MAVGFEEETAVSVGMMVAVGTLVAIGRIVVAVGEGKAGIVTIVVWVGKDCGVRRTCTVFSETVDV